MINRLKKTERLCEKDWKQVTTNESEWKDKWQGVVKWVTTSDHEQQRVATNDNEWKPVTIATKFLFFMNKRGTCD